MCITEARAARRAAKDRYALAIEYGRTEIVTRYRVEYRQACDRVCEEQARLAAEQDAARYREAHGYDVDMEVDLMRDLEMLAAYEAEGSV